MKNKYKVSHYTHFFQLDNKLFILFNGFSRSILKLDEKNYRKLEKLKKKTFKNSEFGNDIFEKLLETLNVVQSEADELSEVIKTFDEKRLKGDTLSLTIAPTMDCNFGCPYCYEIKKPKYMSEETEKNIVEFVLLKLSSVKALNVVWIGGEPLMASDVVFHLTEKIKDLTEKQGIKSHFSIVTNGYFLTEENVKKMLELNINDVQVTIDGPEEIHDKRRFLRKGMGGTYTEIINNLKFCANKFKKVDIRMNIDETNKDKWKELKENLRKEGILNYVKFNLGAVDAVNDHNIKSNKSCLTSDLFAEVKSDLMFDDLDLGISNIFLPSMPVCTAVSKNSFSIDPGGYLYKCWNNIGMKNELIGHVKSPDTFNEKYNNWMGYSIQDYEECKICSILPICMGNCPDKITKFGPTNLVCSPYKKSLRETVLLYYLNKKKACNCNKANDDK